MKQVRIVGVGKTPLGRLGLSATDLAKHALDAALQDAGLASTSEQRQVNDLHGLVAVPSLSNPHFMQAHYLATKCDLLPNKRFVVRTIDTGGAGPVSALSAATSMIRNEWCETVAIVASDAVLSLKTDDFLARADASVQGCTLPSPCIPNGYDLVAQWHIEKHGLKREQLAMVPVIMSYFASQNPDALCKEPYTLKEVLASKPVGKVTNLLECARRADGAAALVLSSTTHYKRFSEAKKQKAAQNETVPAAWKDLTQCPIVISTGEASGPLFPPTEGISKDMFSCERASKFAYKAAQMGPADIDFFGLYDCFPICFIRALEAVKVVPEGKGGDFVEAAYNKLQQTGSLSANDFPFNTHGGLQCFGAPWEVPATYNVIEAVQQLNGTVGHSNRQLSPKPQRALVYGNGGIFSASSVAILGSGSYE